MSHDFFAVSAILARYKWLGGGERCPAYRLIMANMPRVMSSLGNATCHRRSAAGDRYEGVFCCRMKHQNASRPYCRCGGGEGRRG